MNDVYKNDEIADMQILRFVVNPGELGRRQHRRARHSGRVRVHHGKASEMARRGLRQLRKSGLIKLGDYVSFEAVDWTAKCDCELGLEPEPEVLVMAS